MSSNGYSARSLGPPVIDTDIGRASSAICLDLDYGTNFSENHRRSAMSFLMCDGWPPLIKWAINLK